MTKPSKDQFQEYIRLNESGFANLFDGRYICDVSQTGLTPDMCKCIVKHFDALAKEYGVEK